MGVVSVAWAMDAHAARPMLTDDARVVDAGACQVESWVMGQAGVRELWALPACSGGPGVEWALGAQQSRLIQAGAPRLSGLAQYKRLLRELQAGSVGVAVAGGSLLSEDARVLPYLVLPMSWMSPDESTLVHLNVGRASKPRGILKDNTRGLGLEQQLTHSLWLVAERYSPSATQWQAQAGLRWWVVAGQLQLDATTGQLHGAGPSARFASVGLRWIFQRPF
ncbi:MAG: hypothetical protein ACKOCU_05265 [Betaproteobacteria bacterium]